MRDLGPSGGLTAWYLADDRLRMPLVAMFVAHGSFAQLVNFDVAVTVSESVGTGAGIRAAAFGPASRVCAQGHPNSISRTNFELRHQQDQVRGPIQQYAESVWWRSWLGR
jgi:hypothetical protein